MDGERLTNKDLRWAPGIDRLTDAQLEAVRTRDANAIRPIPSRTALGYDHLMADADRSALIAEIDRLRAELAAIAERDAMGARLTDGEVPPSTSLLAGTILLVSYVHIPES